MKEWPVLRLATFDHCRVLAPWCLVRSGNADVFRARRIALQLEETGTPKPPVWESLLAHFFYLLVSLRQIAIVSRPEFRGVRHHYGISPFRQWLDLLRVAWRGNLPPRVYYFQRLFRRDRTGQLSVIEHHELQVLLRAVHAGADTSVLDDKIAFHTFCAQHRLPTPPLLAVYAQGQLQGPEPSAAAWQGDLFGKPARSYASIGIASWKYHAATGHHTDGRETLDRPALQDWFCARSRDCTYVVQPRMGNAPDLLPITGRALANCRVVTARRTDGSLFVLLAALRMGLGKAITSDDPVVMFCAAVDPETGTLSAAETKQAAQGSFDRHPETDAQISGRVLPRWPQMRALALRAHAALPQMIFVGWDVVDTDQGPMLLEGNLVWGGNLAQMAGNPPLGATEFPTLFLHHYERLPRPAVEAAIFAAGLAATAAPFNRASVG